MKTFKSGNNNDRTIDVDTNGNDILLTIRHARNVQSTTWLSREDTQVFALAVLEAVDHGRCRGTLLGTRSAKEVEHMMDAIGSLRQAIQAADTDKAETEDQAKLETEAATLFNAHRGAHGYQWAKWEQATSNTRSAWLTVAKAAREANK